MVTSSMPRQMQFQQAMASMIDDEKPTSNSGICCRHVVICGYITYESVQHFLRDFLHEDRENQNVKCVFMDRFVL